MLSTLYQPTGGGSGLPLISINRFAGSYHAIVINGGGPSGSHFESSLGELVSPGVTSGPTGMSKLYSCDFPGGNMITHSQTCEGTGGTTTFLGWDLDPAAGSNPPTLPAGYTPLPLYRCNANGDHFVSTSSGCEGAKSEGLQGFSITQNTVRSTHAVVDTTKSFTASAWVDPTELATAHQAYTFMSQNGSATWAVLLKFGNGSLQGCVRSQVSGSSSCATASASAGTWVFVTMEYDVVNQQIRLLTNGTLAASGSGNPTATYVQPANETPAAGPFMLGAGMSNGGTGDTFAGYIADPVLVQGIESGRQIQNLRDTGAMNGGF